jgi:type I restriction-modification system DNA methylase subunit
MSLPCISKTQTDRTRVQATITTDMQKAKADLANLVNRFEQIIKSGKEATFSEADVSSKFILPFLDALGWDTKDIDQVKEQRRTLSGPVDYTLSVNRKPRLLLELKKFDEQLDGYREVRGRKETFPEQAARYAWHLKVEWVVLTNFKEVRLYNSYYRKPADGLRLQLRFPQFASELDKLWILSLASVQAGELDKIERKAERKNIDEAVLEDLLEIRRLLSDNISSSNNSLSIRTVRENVQKIMDRLIVIRVAEDKGLIGFESLRKELESWKNRGLPTPFMRSLKSLFRDFDDTYNTKLFEPHMCEDLLIENKIIETVIDILYQYNFDLISADVLGAIYEDYLGHVLQETTSGDVQIIESSEARKKEGIYYTPTHLVEYVVNETLGEILAECKSPDDVAKIKILDPACGSGSFLIKAFDLIKEWYENYNSKLTSNDGSLDSHLQKVTDIERKILADNLFGVDIDQEAAEIAAVNLMLKAIRRGEKLPQILGQNIRVGNSLVNGSEEGFNRLSPEAREGLRPFKWEQEFQEILVSGGFDVVVGNPPYYKVRKKNPIRISPSYDVVKTGPVNAAMMFIDQAIKLTKPKGKIGLVLPKMLSYTKGWEGSRRIVFGNCVESIIDCQEAFEKVLLEQILLTLEKVVPEESHSYQIGEAKGFDIAISPKRIPQSLATKEDFLFLEPSEVAYRIREKMLNGTRLLGDVCDIILGLGIQSFDCWREIAQLGDLSILRGNDIQMWHIRSCLYFSPSALEMQPYSNNIASVHVPHIVAQRIIAHIRRPKPHIILMAAYDTRGSFAFNTVTHLLVKDIDFDYRYILGLLNSKLFSFYAYKFVYNNAIRSMDFYKDYSERLPVKPLSMENQKEISDIVDSIIAHFQDPRHLDPIYKKYITEKVIGAREFVEYYRKLSPNERDPKDSRTKGTVKKLLVREDGDWLSFRVDYLDQGQRRIITDYEILRCKFRDREIRSFLLTEINSRKAPNRGKRLLDKILSVRLPSFHKDADRNKELITSQLKPFLKDADSHIAWKNEYRSLDDRLNKRVYQIYGLDEEEARHVEENSKPSGWLAEEAT